MSQEQTILMRELAQAVEVLKEAVEKSREIHVLNKLLAEQNETLQITIGLLQLILQQVFVYQLLDNLNPKEKAQNLRTNFLALLERRCEVDMPVKQQMLIKATEFFDGIVTVFDKANGQKPESVEEDWPDDLNL